MFSPEHVFYRQRVVFAPDSKTGDDASDETSGEPLQQQVLLEETTQNTSLKNQEQRAELGPTGFWMFESQGVDWEEDFSENGKWLFWWLSGEQGDLDLLHQRAELDRMDLEAAIQELDSFGLLEKSNPNLLKLAKRWITYDQPSITQ